MAVQMVPTLVVRGIIQGFDYGYEPSIDGIQYDGKLKLSSYGAQMDWRPPLVPLYVTAGIFANDNHYSLSVTPTGNVEIGNKIYTPAQVGTLSSKAKFDDVAYFLGAGLKLDLGPLETALEAGVYSQGKPIVDYSASGSLASNPTFQADLALEKEKMSQELKPHQYWPMITLFARWKF
ncbi:hypothetical protein [Candidatus Phycosocius spiralis]|uniref:Outer membrane protein beta-barrel domain-containing protein n=1 Tax=Candidatus Phycosocius spiralis TaxID=2815099 RepID=A0ABQ4PTE0_9PROT|nr:hypothetical protein [Candidatus Phycosocius spiralis]GIU65988.1 hypothetical protein PsB1_0142 [Candidatus Phycosocius spiralis]